ncbi:Tim44 domain-containing protein [Thauera linaloolentis]|uniref:Import inner membrane translocase subunit Tim44 n=1 Tax=Thauera linaloolentis (strain DSM 12138 / JCM 21573 / CCUG 41526 / CIP 105981 / IAM 15112 / NBRC 102519 / 47Lol) TaxID=1123367 RepID=N6Z1Z7_THAL4|nr:TIM44-like domain-containing protein [Thauera linaloolentis]ENO86189.1 import inner membrane translocase subunit Tim44 [Thauera linaloolentis 47Lol = DSM 12138]MCM8567237.1 Tim44-like domain-containing protein [Thauera linaloolentis]
MKNLILTLIVAILSFGFGAPEAEAKRLGGGSSFGMKRNATPQQAPRQPAATQTPPAGAGAAAAPKRSWMGPIAGLAAGLGLAALFSHLGLGEEMASFMMILLLAAAAFFIFRLLFRRGGNTRQSQNLQYAGAGAASGGAAALRPAPAAAAPASGAIAASGLDKAVAEGFDVQGFARQAKLNFIRLQAANDAGNLDDLREFTTPEVFAEICMQLNERGAAVQRTDVVELNADVVDVAEEGERYIVSVRFNGLLREAEDAAPAAFDEIWHLTKPLNGQGGWLIAGIQQID